MSEPDSSPPRGNPFPVVGIGASAGGLEAFSQLLAAIPPSTGMAFVLIQHLDPQHPSLLTEILSPVAKIPVLTVRDGMPLEPDHVYVMPPNTSMFIEGSHFKLVEREAGLHFPIDTFFRSLAEVQGSRAVGVVLSGSASDGSLGLRAIKAACGITFAQDEASARFSSMPRSAAATGAADYILPPVAIARELAILGTHPYLLPARPGDAHSETLPDGDGELRRAFTLLRAATTVDFSHYKPTTVRRRIGRRMMVLRCRTLGEYVTTLSKNPAEIRELYRDLLISVTSFFRDPEAFDAIASELSEILARNPRRRDPIRVWVPGCATGEELYSLAICINEVLQRSGIVLPLQLFGTDISELALDRARHAIYSDTIAESVSPERLSRFFVRTDGHYQIAKFVRESCIFARHDITRDPPFSRIDLLSCRNLLIYLDTQTQTRVLPIFHYALKPDGLLLLGSAETTAAAPELFVPSHKQLHIYRPKPGSRSLKFDLTPGNLALAALPTPDSELASTVPDPRESDLQKRLTRFLEVTNPPGGSPRSAPSPEEPGRESSDPHEYLRTLAEDYQAHVEELWAANEEIRSSNEELQSTNEELSTTKEELQSTNEELTTINEEIQHRNQELSSANSDIKNLLGAVSVAILMADSDLRVRRFNPAAEKLLGLDPADIGRPIGHIRGRIYLPDLEKQARHVIDALQVAEREFQDDTGHWYSLTLRPCRTVDDRIAGAVITIQDIDLLKRGLEAAKEAREYANEMIETVREPLVVLDADLRVQRATRAFYETFLVSSEETEGRFLYDLGNGQWNRPRLRELIGAALFRNEPFQDYEFEHDFPHIGRRTVRLNGRRIPRQDPSSRTLLLAIEDVTEHHVAAEISFQRLFETAQDGLLLVEAEAETVLDVNPCFLQLTGFPREQIAGWKLSEAPPFRDVPEFASLINILKKDRSVRYADIGIRTAAAGSVSMELRATLFQAGSQPVVQLNLRDISLRKEHEDVLHQAIEEKAVLVREIHHRVKNNLQVIVSLLSLQANYTKDPKALAAFEETEGRVRAIAHIHEALYASTDLAQIEFGGYLGNLVRELLALHSKIPGGIILDLKTEEMVLHMEQAIPLGLIANELILNALKHGLREGCGHLAVTLAYLRTSNPDRSLDEGWGELRVSDSGPGLPEDVNLAEAQSMGFRLLNLLIKQLHGTVALSHGPGATVCIEFPLAYQ